MAEPQRLSLLQGRLIDPARGIDEILDLHVENGLVAGIGQAPQGFKAERILDVAGFVVCPGLVDLCARLREPGAEHKATIASETRAAAAAGITTLCCPPDTDPIIDTPAVAELIRQKAEIEGYARVLPLGALTAGLRGEHLTAAAALQRAGCVALSDGGRPTVNSLAQRHALAYASTFGMTAFLTPLDATLMAQGCIHEGRISTRLGLPGIPEAAETAGLARDLALVEQLEGVRVHFRGLSSARAARRLTQAMAEGLPVSADVAIHQLFMTEEDVQDFDGCCHVLPPFRSLVDREALRQAVAAGHIAAVCSDHQPHEPDAKLCPFPDTEPGISALETLLPLVLRLVDENLLGLADALARVTSGPADILGLPYGRLPVGGVADVCVFDPAATWRLDPSSWFSRGHNTPLTGWMLRGRVEYTLLAGQLVFMRHET
ncbi:MAG: dihydroorotase [Pseudomonadota bacterium]